MAVAFEIMSPRSQVAAIKRAIRPVLAEHNLGKAKPELLLHGYNTTFTVNVGGQKCALRINVNSRRTLAEIKGEVAWTAALGGVVLAPVPVTAFAGSAIVEIPWEFEERNLYGVLYSWVEGRHYSEAMPRSAAKRLGQLTADLHRHTTSFLLPPEAHRQHLSDPLDGLTNLLPNDGVFSDCLERAQAAIDRLQRTQKRQLIHFDLHVGNVKIGPQGISVFDFDDCSFAWPIVDAAQTVYHIRCEANGEDRERAYWEGLAGTVESLGGNQVEFEALVAARNLLLANALLETVNPEWAAMRERYVEVTRLRLEAFLRSGVYDPRVAIFEP